MKPREGYVIVKAKDLKKDDIFNLAGTKCVVTRVRRNRPITHDVQIDAQMVDDKWTLIIIRRAADFMEVIRA